jgi:small subunit ribosomal protein S6
MKHYELLYIIPGKYTEEEIDTIGNKVIEVVKGYGGEITFTDNLGDKKLSFPIDGMQTGSYLVIEFNAEPARIKDLDGELKLTPEVLRHQIVAKKVLTQAEIEQEKKRQERLVEKPVEEKPAVAPAPKVTLEELDKKLGEILEGDIL